MNLFFEGFDLHINKNNSKKQTLDNFFKNKSIISLNKVNFIGFTYI